MIFLQNKRSIRCTTNLLTYVCGFWKVKCCIRFVYFSWKNNNTTTKCIDWIRKHLFTKTRDMSGVTIWLHTSIPNTLKLDISLPYWVKKGFWKRRKQHGVKSLIRHRRPSSNPVLTFYKFSDSFPLFSALFLYIITCKSPFHCTPLPFYRGRYLWKVVYWITKSSIWHSVSTLHQTAVETRMNWDHENDQMFDPKLPLVSLLWENREHSDSKSERYNRNQRTKELTSFGHKEITEQNADLH